jgi:hypothetical protein
MYYYVVPQFHEPRMSLIRVGALVLTMTAPLSLHEKRGRLVLLELRPRIILLEARNRLSHAPSCKLAEPSHIYVAGYE